MKILVETSIALTICGCCGCRSSEQADGGGRRVQAWVHDYIYNFLTKYLIIVAIECSN